jgi:hypothetical protein
VKSVAKFVGLIVASLLLVGLLIVIFTGNFPDIADDNPFTVVITNNTASTVFDHDYFKPGGPVVLKPGQSFHSPEYSNEGVDVDRITDSNGSLLGCLPFHFSSNPPNQIVVRISEMVPCKDLGKYNSRDWPG